MSLLRVPTIRVVLGDGSRSTLTIPGVFEALMHDEIESFLALRPHQRHAWHAFLVQVGALALLAAERFDLPEDQEDWAILLRGLTPDFPDDEPWTLVTSPNCPAILQSPLASATLTDLKKVFTTPDELDILITAKNHDLKMAVMLQAAPDDWFFALLTLQTMEGYLGATNFGVSRMNGGFANRPALGIVPSGGTGKHVRRDIGRLLALRYEIGAGIYAASGGLGLVWLRPWDGVTSIKPSELNPYYVEVCRRVRLVEVSGSLQARAGGSKAPRIMQISGGLTGDPWAPVVTDKDGTSKVLTVDATGFSYRRLVQLIFGQDGIQCSALQDIVEGEDDNEGLVLLARALTRGQGKTEGYHERRVLLSNRFRHGFGRAQDSDKFAGAARNRVLLAGELQNRVLKLALLALFENGPAEINFRNNGANGRASRFLKYFDECVDRTFFPSLWEEFEDGIDTQAVRSAWLNGLIKIARELIDQADKSASKAVKRRYRARAQADAIFSGALRRNQQLSPFLLEAENVKSR